MTTAAWAAAGLSAIAAAVDWWGVLTEQVRIRYAAKPATLVALIAVAVLVDPTVGSGVRTAMVVGLVLSLAGDVFLMFDERWFVAGLASFLAGHVAYVVGLQLAPTSLAWSLVGLALVVVCIATVGRRIVTGVAAGQQRDLIGPVIAYLVVISAMVVSAFGTQAPWAMIGALLFYASDATLALNRFLEQRPRGPIAVMVTYHLGQAGLVAWLVTG